jgi:hypothetical protein
MQADWAILVDAFRKAITHSDREAHENVYQAVLAMSRMDQLALTQGLSEQKDWN